ncbi:MAG: hypothetical protein IH889_01505 [Planctomycetes bacterium]|nr:hypothetical protein [Planctomycetota bacterium]
MKRNTLILLVLVLGVLVTAGCSAPQGASLVEETVSMAVFGPGESQTDARPNMFYLGAGDPLGYEIFVNYVAFVRANHGRLPHYANVKQGPQFSK